LYEGFGIPLLEAMALSCPVVCSNASSFPEVVGNAADLFDPFDEESLRSTIERVVFSMEHRDFLIGRGLDRARLFSWDRCAEETLQVYAN
jgi:glycosyltransferase involved in cell wall biosynthesis